MHINIHPKTKQPIPCFESVMDCSKETTTHLANASWIPYHVIPYCNRCWCCMVYHVNMSIALGVHINWTFLPSSFKCRKGNLNFKYPIIEFELVHVKFLEIGRFLRLLSPWQENLHQINISNTAKNFYQSPTFIPEALPKRNVTCANFKPHALEAIGLALKIAIQTGEWLLSSLTS